MTQNRSKAEKDRERFKEKVERNDKTLEVFVKLRRKVNVQGGSWKPA